jgi:hypothetical protein
LRLAEQLDGAPRNLSIHCGGVVIGDRPLTYYLPLERAAKGIVVSQFEMRAIEAIGLVKMDLLGNRALTTIGECVTLVREHRGLAVDVERLPDPEPRTRRASPPATRSTASSSNRRPCATCSACCRRARSRRRSPRWRWCAGARRERHEGSVLPPASRPRGRRSCIPACSRCSAARTA